MIIFSEFCVRTVNAEYDFIAAKEHKCDIKQGCRLLKFFPIGAVHVYIDCYAI